MQADARFVQDVHTAHQRRTETRGKVDALAFAARKGIAQSCQRQVTQSHIHEELQAALDFGQQPLGYLLLLWSHLQGTEKLVQVADGKFAQVGDAPSTYLHILCFLLQPSSVAGGAGGLASVAGQHHAILDFILILPQHAEKLVDANGAVAPFVLLIHPMPQHFFLPFGQLAVRCEDGKILVFLSPPHKLLLPFRHLLAFPGSHATVIHRELGVGNDQTLVDADDSAVPLTLWASTHGRIEGKHLVGRFLKLHAVGFKLQRKRLLVTVLKLQDAHTVTLIQCRVGRIDQTVDGRFLVGHLQAVND